MPYTLHNLFSSILRPTPFPSTPTSTFELTDLEQAPLLGRRVEVATIGCVRSLQGSTASNIDTIVIGLAESKKELPNRSHLRSLVAHTPAIKKLVILHADEEVDEPGRAAPEPRQTLQFPSLLDVTILSTTTLDPSPITESLLLDLPKGVRFLHVLGDSGLSGLADSAAHPPAFQLFGLTVQHHPSPVTDWITLTSWSTLQCLTVARVASLPTLTSTLPNLRSLRILNRKNSSLKGIENLKDLQHLEIRAENILELEIRLLPPTLRHFRFWSPGIAEGLSAPGGRTQLRQLETVVWDYWRIKGGKEDVILQRLREACDEEKVALQTYLRIDRGKRASKGQDPVLEEQLIQACFTDLGEAGQPSEQTLAVLGQASNTLPANVLSAMIEQDVPLSRLFTETSLDADISWPRPILETGFPDHLTWVANRLPKAEAKRDEITTSFRRDNLAIRGKEGWFAKLENVWPRMVVFGGLAIIGTALFLLFQVFKGNLDLQLWTLVGAAVFIHILQLFAIPVIRSGGTIDPDTLLNVAIGVLVFSVLWGILTALTVTVPAWRERRVVMGGLCIVGTIVPTIVGGVVLGLTKSNRMPYTRTLRQ